MAHKPKILIVEDNKMNHHLYRHMFEHAGFEVVIQEGADEFFADTVSDIRPDIISMDLMIEPDDGIPKRDGFWAIEMLKKDLRTHEIPIIILTNFFEEGRVKRAKELGAVDFLNTTGEAVSKIPEHYLKYLKRPNSYMPVHPLFRSK